MTDRLLRSCLPGSSGRSFDPRPWLRRHVPVGLFSLLAVIALGWCQKDSATPPPDTPSPSESSSTDGERTNVLLVTLDTTRADRVGCYGGRIDVTPNLDRLAREGVRFARAHAPVPLTLPSHATLLTGLHPVEHGVRSNTVYRLPAEIPTLATTLQEQGYRTGAFVAAFVLDSGFGLDRGFDLYDDEFGCAAPGHR